MSEKVWKSAYALLEPVLTVFDTYRHVAYLSQHAGEDSTALAQASGRFKFSAVTPDKLDDVRARLVPGACVDDVVVQLCPEYSKLARFKLMNHTQSEDAYQFIHGFIAELKASVKPAVQAELSDDDMEKFARFGVLYFMAPKVFGAVPADGFVPLFNSLSKSDVSDMARYGGLASEDVSVEDLKRLKTDNGTYQAELQKANDKLRQIAEERTVAGMDPMARSTIQKHVRSFFSYDQGDVVDKPEDEYVKDLCEFGLISIVDGTGPDAGKKLFSRPVLKDVVYPFLTRVESLTDDPEVLSGYRKVASKYAKDRLDEVSKKLLEVREEIKGLPNDFLTNPDSAAKARSLNGAKYRLELIKEVCEAEIKEYLHGVDAIITHRKGVIERQGDISKNYQHLLDQFEGLKGKYRELSGKYTRAVEDGKRANAVAKTLVSEQKKYLKAIEDGKTPQQASKKLTLLSKGRGKGGKQIPALGLDVDDGAVESPEVLDGLVELKAQVDAQNPAAAPVPVQPASPVLVSVAQPDPVTVVPVGAEPSAPVSVPAPSLASPAPAPAGDAKAEAARKAAENALGDL